MNIVSVLIILVCFSAVFSQHCNCGVETIDSRVVGGTVVEDGKYPWMAFLNVSTKMRNFQCGGAILNDQYIVTAAHCTLDAKEIRVGVGSNSEPYLNSNLREIDTFLKHPNYNPENDHNDIALIKLAEPLTVTNSVRPVCLPPANMNTNGILIVAGWGLTEHRQKSPDLLEASVEEYDFDSCNLDWENDLTSTQFCASLIGKDSCGGDSGGPLVKRSHGRSYIVGVISFGPPECGSARHAVYTKVTDFLDWIQENTEDGVYCSN